MNIGRVLVLLLLSALPLPAMAADDAQLKRGKLLFLQCRACHDTQPGTVPKVGPDLGGIFGRPAASAPGFATYSDAMKRSGIVWSRETLDKWIERPSAMVPGTTMAFAGVASATDRAAIIAFLEQETASQ